MPIETGRSRGVSLVRVGIGVVAVLAGLVWLGPWGLYQLGLSNIEGRPIALVGHSNSEDIALLTSAIKARSGIKVVPLSPGRYFASLVLEPETSAAESGADAAWVVARDYNALHLRNRSSMWWHLSGAALTIWITRNWTPDQVIARAADLERKRRSQRGQ